MLMPNTDNTLLIIDDEREVLNAVRRQFRKKYRVFIAENACEAFNILNKETVHVVVSDQRMPEMTGTEIFETVKTQQPDIIRLILTGYSDIQAVMDAINISNVYQFILKPWKIEHLDHAVEKAFEHYWLKNYNQALLTQLQTTNVALEKEIDQRKAAEIELKKHRDQLEQEVDKRTAELRQTNQKLLEARIIAERANESKSIFVANVVHDIKAPLNGIMLTGQILLDTSLTDEQMEFVKLIESSSNTLLKLLNDIMDFSKIEANKLTLESIKFNIYQTYEQTIHLLDVMAKQKNVDLKYSIEKNIPEILIGDPLRIQQVLFNLVGNAIKFTDKGHVSISVSVIDIDDSLVTLKTIIKDTGIGISKKQIEKLFFSYYQADKSIARKYGGTGLGLNISKKLVEMMNGSIHVDSEINIGSTFTFTIPIGYQTNLPQ